MGQLSWQWLEQEVQAQGPTAAQEQEGQGQALRQVQGLEEEALLQEALLQLLLISLPAASSPACCLIRMTSTPLWPSLPC